jgi:hypothetical protein
MTDTRLSEHFNQQWWAPYTQLKKNKKTHLKKSGKFKSTNDAHFAMYKLLGQNFFPPQNHSEVKKAVSSSNNPELSQNHNFTTDWHKTLRWHNPATRSNSPPEVTRVGPAILKVKYDVVLFIYVVSVRRVASRTSLLEGLSDTKAEENRRGSRPLALRAACCPL